MSNQETRCNASGSPMPGLEDPTAADMVEGSNPPRAPLRNRVNISARLRMVPPPQMDPLDQNPAPAREVDTEKKDDGK